MKQTRCRLVRTLLWDSECESIVELSSYLVVPRVAYKRKRETLGLASLESILVNVAQPPYIPCGEHSLYW